MSCKWNMMKVCILICVPHNSLNVITLFARVLREVMFRYATFVDQASAVTSINMIFFLNVPGDFFLKFCYDLRIFNIVSYYIYIIFQKTTLFKFQINHFVVMRGYWLPVTDSFDVTSTEKVCVYREKHVEELQSHNIKKYFLNPFPNLLKWTTILVECPLHIEF